MVGTTRLEAFSDGVFAIAITLLVIEIRAPAVDPGESLAHALFGEWPHYVGYGVSFLVLGVMWLNHHRVFQAVEQIDGLILVLNLNLLLWAGLIPFPTAVVAEHLRDGGSNAKTAVALYGALVLLTAISFTALFFALTRPVVVGVTHDPVVIRSARLRFGVGIVVYAAAFGLSFIAPPVALAAHAAMASYYLLKRSSKPSERVAGK